MFWRFGGYTNVSQIDSVLDKPDVTVEELLDEGDLIQEIKQQNSKLIEFLREELVLKQLLEYVVADKPTPAARPDTIHEDDVVNEKHDQAKGKDVEKRDKNEKATAKIGFFGRSRSRSKSVNKRNSHNEEEERETRRKKYAYIASEILSSEVWSITEAMLESQEYLHDFWEYLRRPAPLDPVQASYFTKINENLLDKKTEEMFIFLKSLDGIVPEMLKHVDCPMVMDLLLKMISLEKADGGQGIVDWLQGQSLIPILLSYLGPDNSPATQTSAGDFLKAIITISANATGQDQTVIGPNELTRQLVSKKCVIQLIEDMLTGGNPLTVGVGIVIEVIRKNNSDYDMDHQAGPEPRTTDPIYLGTLLREFAKHVPDFMQLVRNSKSKRPELKAAFGQRIEPLGFDRFKTCELMAELLHCSNMALLNERGSENDMLARDVEREHLKAEGKLGAAPSTHTEGDDAFASSVDSHGFHHAQAPEDDSKQSSERGSRLEVQNATDEDGFEQVAVPEAEALPDELSFDEINEKAEESTLPPPPLKVSKSPEKKADDSDLEDISIDADELSLDDVRKDKRRVSLLTQQIQDQIDETEAGTPPGDLDVGDTEDAPAPLFAGKASPTKAVDPILGAASPTDDIEPGTQSTATLLPGNDAAADRDQQPFEVDVDGQPVVGDYLKRQFTDHDVVPTILDFFFRFPWNNFLHNVVYDIVQQVFNGTLERGYNRTLAQNLFITSSCAALISKEDITTRILSGQAASDQSQTEKGMRLGYMGHLTLIAEEVCKFAERHPPELLGEEVMKRVTLPEWAEYVGGTLTETRDRDNAVLGGVRPDQSMGVRSLAGGGGLLSQGGGGGGFGGANSNALASAGLVTPSDSLALHDAGEYEGGATRTGLLSGFGDAEDEDEDEDEGEDGEEAGMTSGGIADKRQPVEDDQQPAPPASPGLFLTAEPTPAAPASTTGSIVPPLNVPPSRARRQLAARLAQRRREAAALEEEGGEEQEGEEEDEEEEEEEEDPDRASDAIALAATRGLPDEPLGNNSATGPSVPAAALPTQPATTTTTGLFARTSSTFDDDDDDDTNSSGLSNSSDDDRAAYRNVSNDGTARRNSNKGGERFHMDDDNESSEEDEGEEVEIALVRRGSAGSLPTSSSFSGQVTDSSTSTSTSGRRDGLRRRPSTTEAKVRRPIEDEDEDGEEEEEEEEEEMSSDEDVVEMRPRRTS